VRTKRHDSWSSADYGSRSAEQLTPRGSTQFVQNHNPYVSRTHGAADRFVLVGDQGPGLIYVYKVREQDGKLVQVRGSAFRIAGVPGVIRVDCGVRHEMACRLQRGILSRTDDRNLRSRWQLSAMLGIEGRSALDPGTNGLTGTGGAQLANAVVPIP
jgi:hypothetical protein